SWCASACKLWNENCHQKVPWICPKDGTTGRILLSTLPKHKNPWLQRPDARWGRRLEGSQRPLCFCEQPKRSVLIPTRQAVSTPCAITTRRGIEHAPPVRARSHTTGGGYRAAR